MRPPSFSASFCAVVRATISAGPPGGYDAADRRDVADEIEIELVVERYVDCVVRSGQEERISVRGSLHDRLSANVATGTGPVLDDKWLTEPLRQLLTDEARENAGSAAGAKPTTIRTGRVG
jgi:hypothetical protein